MYHPTMTAKTAQPAPALKMARIILFTAQIDEMSRFYGQVLGLKQITDEKGWREFAAGEVRIAPALRTVFSRAQRSENRLLRERRCLSPRIAGCARCKVRKGSPGRCLLPLRWQGPGWQSPSIVRPLKTTRSGPCRDQQTLTPPIPIPRSQQSPKPVMAACASCKT